jgi:NAD(P)-dependent dehydrogenase (short-subunit alcohol dehydrogenase family)
MSTASKPATAALALITGASSGIGAIYDDRLAKRGRSVAPLFRPFVSSKLSLAVRVLLRENSNGVVVFEYDRPASVFGQFENDQVDVVAQRLDQDLQSALEAAAILASRDRNTVPAHRRR